MSSARKKAAIRKANNEADHLRQQLMLAEHHYGMMKTMAFGIAQKNLFEGWLPKQVSRLYSPLKINITNRLTVMHNAGTMSHLKRNGRLK